MSKMSIDPGADARALRRHALSGPAMGARWSAVFFAAGDVDEAALTRRLQGAVERVEQQMSTFRPESDLERLNAAQVGIWIDIPRELMHVLATALEVGRLSGGAFDIGVGDLVKAWGFGGARMPDGGRIAALAGRPSFEPPKTLQLDPAACRARRLAPLRLDLAGIAKGFGVDELAREMLEAGLSSWLVGIDGEMRAQGLKPDGRPWTVAHERPSVGRRDILGVLELSGAAVATSGNYRHRVEVAGRTLSHTMDPSRGAPLDNDLAAVTVLGETCMAADAWATALLVHGAIEGPALARRLGLAALFVRADGEAEMTWPLAPPPEPAIAPVDGRCTA
ncbi:FAD:protein FMN transferase [Xanthobacter autotrophicus]|uniref:FAD:protein FMN transferase n=1 Tax=Xanthobacter TaxID=279 RepID=UPI0024AA59AC|nr:FAD:protein FMN transferase [Xanthobacter autotrophicus]MDI4665492.1 FAD:protein FMN transferase [Xanthobacter autotrophicus]